MSITDSERILIDIERTSEMWKRGGLDSANESYNKSKNRERERKREFVHRWFVPLDRKNIFQQEIVIYFWDIRFKSKETIWILRFNKHILSLGHQLLGGKIGSAGGYINAFLNTHLTIPSLTACSKEV